MSIPQPEDVSDHGGGCGGPGVGQPPLQQDPRGREVLVEEMPHDRLESPRSGHLLICILFPFLNQGSMLKSAFSTNARSRFASAVVDGVLGPPRLARHTGVGVLVSL